MTTDFNIIYQTFGSYLSDRKTLNPLKIWFQAHELAMMISIALRFIPDLLDEAKRIMKTQASRGVDILMKENCLKNKSNCIINNSTIYLHFKRAKI